MTDSSGVPRGAVRERDVKPFLLSPFGRELAENKSLRLPVVEFMRPIATIECGVEVGPWLEQVQLQADDGAVVTQATQYAGYLSPAALIRLANEVRLEEAKSRNPLTGMLGNDAIESYMRRLATTGGEDRVMAYVDIDNFKPFNDKYGFATGDRAIDMMATILKSMGRDYGVWVGHVGGDDFVLSGAGDRCAVALTLLQGLGKRFRHVAESLYSAEDRAAGFIVGKSRDGVIRDFPLLSATSAAVRLHADYSADTTEELSARLAALKGEARKLGTDFLAVDLGKDDDVAAAG